MRLSDPRPSVCTVCCNSGHENTKFVDTGAFREGPLLRDSATGEIAVDASGAQISLDGIEVCDACVREMVKELGESEYSDTIKRQFVEIRKGELRADHWKAAAERKDREIERLREYITQLETVNGSLPQRQRVRKAA